MSKQKLIRQALIRSYFNNDLIKIRKIVLYLSNQGLSHKQVTRFFQKTLDIDAREFEQISRGAF